VSSGTAASAPKLLPRRSPGLRKWPLTCGFALLAGSLQSLLQRFDSARRLEASDLSSRMSEAIFSFRSVSGSPAWWSLMTPRSAPSAPKTLPRRGPTVGFVEKRNSRSRARYRDPLGRLTSKTFVRKADAQRFPGRMAGRPSASHPYPQHPLARPWGADLSARSDAQSGKDELGVFDSIAYAAQHLF